MGFKEIPHSADWAMRVWAEDLAGLLAESARGMNALAGVQISPDVRAKRILELEGTDDESLLVSFLSELLYIQEQENLAFDRFSIQITGRRLVAEMSGGRIASLEKAIKAVTWHNLRIERRSLNLEVEIVFDV